MKRIRGEDEPASLPARWGTQAHSRTAPAKLEHMTGIIVTLLVIWLILAILGAVLEGLFWLTIVAIVLLLATGAYGWMKRQTSSSP